MVRAAQSARFPSVQIVEPVTQKLAAAVRVLLMLKLHVPVPVQAPPQPLNVEPDPDKIKVGMDVVVHYDDVTDAITLPKFRPA